MGNTRTRKPDAKPSRSKLCNLVLVYSDGRIRSDELQLVRGRNPIGRHMFDAEGFSLSDAVSREHAIVDVVSHDEIYVEYLGGKNGTLINGTRAIGRVPIGHQSVLACGDAI